MDYLYRLRFFGLGLLILTGFLLFSVVLAPFTGQDSSPSEQYSASYSYDEPNVVTGGLFEITDSIGRITTGVITATDRAVRSTAYATRKTLYFAGRTTASGFKSVAYAGKTCALLGARGLWYVVRFAGATSVFVIQKTASGVVVVVKIPMRVVGWATSSSAVSAAIRPASVSTVPVIKPYTPQKIMVNAQIPDAPVAGEQVTAHDSSTVWPIQGKITTNFGVPHWPYQPTHTGIDISDGKPAGITSVKAFRSGRVIDTVKSNVSLGNHVIVDHGGGLVSVYGHLSSITVQSGQEVGVTTELGREGTTGASTGTHLHFEIRLNGQLVNPLGYLPKE